MDNAMVEAAAYTLERSRPATMTPFIRAITERDCEAIVRDSIASINSATANPHLFLARQDIFRKLAASPFVYWTAPDDFDCVIALPTLEPEAAEVRQGLSTGDDPRFVRAVWEVAPEDTQFVYYPTTGEAYCRFDDPIVVAYHRRRHAGTPRWAFHVKSRCLAAMVFADHSEGRLASRRLQTTKLNEVADGMPRAVARNMAYYCRPGFSWTRRATRFYPYVVPGNCIPSASRYMAFPEDEREYDVLGRCGFPHRLRVHAVLRREIRMAELPCRESQDAAMAGTHGSPTTVFSRVDPAGGRTTAAGLYEPRTVSRVSVADQGKRFLERWAVTCLRRQDASRRRGRTPRLRCVRNRSGGVSADRTGRH